MMGKHCMITPKSKEDFDRLRKEFPMAVTMFHSDGCPHCRDLLPIVEKRCKDVEGYVPVIDCSVDDKDFCIDQIKKYHKDGIPLLVGTEKGNIKKPVFMIEGANKAQLNKNFDILKKIVNDAKKKGTKSPPNPEINNEEPIPSSGGNYGDVDDMVNAVLGFDPTPRARGPVNLCTPGFDCDTREYEDQAIQFLLSNKEKRNKDIDWEEIF